VWEHKYGVEFAPSHLSSSWNGKAIPLRRYQRLEDEYSQSHVGVWTVLDTLIRQRGCAWQAIPRFLKKVDQQRQATLAANRTSALPSLDSLDSNSDKACGSLKAYVLERGK
jgi:hypothetical protein